jgi:cytidine deaminase
MIARMPRTEHGRGENDPLRFVVAYGPNLVRQARVLRSQADHHNGVNVGCVAVGYSEDGSISMATGANQNLYRGTNKTKVCAEQVALQKLRVHGFSRAVALFVSGTHQKDTQSGLSLPTLPVCGECRLVMANEPELVPEDTLIITVRPRVDRFEIHTLDVVQAIHRDRIQHVTAHEDPDFRKWAEFGVELYDDLVEAMPDTPRAYLAQMAITGQEPSRLGLVA